MKKFFIGLGIFFVLAGIVFCAADTKDTSARAQALYDAPVVTMQDLEEWKNQDTQQEVVVTQIPLTGDLVSDPRKFLDGQFYYLKVEKWVYQKEEDEDSSGWEKENGGSYTVRGDHVAAALDDQTELTEDNVRGLEWFDEVYPGGKNGDTRYQIWGLGEDAQLTAVALVGNGEVTVQKPSEGHAYLYFYGTEDDFYQYVEDFVEGDSFLLLIVGWFLAAICFGIAWLLLRGHKASGNIFYNVCSVCGCPEAGVSAIERCRKTAVLGTENRGYSVGNRRICGDLDAFGQYIMDCGRNGASDFWSRGMDGFVCVGRESGGAGRERLNGGFIQYMKEAGSRLRPQSA